MKELSLDEIKQTELGILRTFDLFCKENNIRYFLTYGTLLGAIRYKKFIPWDDDLDVLVPREDYDRLLTLFKDNDRYCLYAFERNPQYRFPFAKLCDRLTRLTEIFYPNNGVDLGVNIDIFPLDNWDNDFKKAKKEAKRIGKYTALLSWTKGTGKSSAKNPLKFLVWSAIIGYCKMRGSEYYIRKIDKECRKFSQKESIYVGTKAWPIYEERGIIPAEVFADTIEVEFEGEKYPAPAGYDQLLTCLYGDYLPEPPKEKQKTHHSFKAYRL